MSAKDDRTLFAVTLNHTPDGACRATQDSQRRGDDFVWRTGASPRNVEHCTLARGAAPPFEPPPSRAVAGALTADRRTVRVAARVTPVQHTALAEQGGSRRVAVSQEFRMSPRAGPSSAKGRSVCSPERFLAVGPCADSRTRWSAADRNLAEGNPPRRGVRRHVTCRILGCDPAPGVRPGR